MSRKKDKLIKESVTVVIHRSQIHFAPYNPKKHTDDAIKQQAKNFKSKGFFGGIVWNALSGNLVSGHKRIMAMDKINGYDGSPETDYDVKVEKCELSDKEEKEQNVFMDARSSNTDQDYELLAVLLPEIDAKEAGLDDLEIELIVAESPELGSVNTGAETIKEELNKVEKPYEDRKAAIKEMKEQIKNSITNEQGANYVTLSFDDYNNKAQFMTAMGYDSDSTVIKGELFYEKLQENA